MPTTAVTQSGSPTIVVPYSGAADGLNYNAFPGFARGQAPHTPSGTAMDVTVGKTASAWIGFNGACRCANGDLLVVGGWAGTDSAGPRYTGFLRCPAGSDPSVLGNWSYEGSKSWTGVPTAGDGFDCFALSVLANGDVLCTGIQVNPTYGPTTRIARSTDHGHTFNTPVPITTWGDNLLGNIGTWAGGSDGSGTTLYSSGDAHRNAYGPILEASNGDLITAFMRMRGINAGPAAGTGGFAIESYIARSTDGGLTWRNAVLAMDSGNDPYAAYTSYDEPLLVRLKNGKLAMFARTWVFDGRTNNITVVYSSDEGATWTQPVECFPHAGGHPMVIAAPNGTLVACYRYHGGSFGSTSGPTWTRSSADNGKTWTNEVQIGAVTPNHLSSYGQMVVLDPTGQTTNDVACFFGEESSTTGAGGGVWFQKFAQGTSNYSMGYHHANNHPGTGQNKLSIRRGTSLSGMSEIAGSPLVNLTGINVADVSNFRLSDGRVGVCWNESTTPGHAYITTVVNFKYALSTDGGATYGTIQNVPVPGWATQVTPGSAGGAYAVAPCPPVEIPAGQPHAGDLLIATYGWDNRAIEDGGGSFSAHEYVKLVRFAPDTPGTTTVVSTIFPDGAGTAYDETALLYLNDGTLLTVSRKVAPSSQLVAKRSAPGSNGAVWGSEYVVKGSHGGRPSLWQGAYGGILLRFRYMDPTYSSSWTGYCLSTDNGLTFGPDIDPFDGTVGRTGGVNQIIARPTRGPDIYGAFADTPDPNVVRYIWCEELSPGGDTGCQIYGRDLTLIGTYGSGPLTLGANAYWAQAGTALTVNGSPGVRTSVSAEVSSTAGGLVRFTGTHADRFFVSLDGSTWTPTLTVAAGLTTIYISALPLVGDTTITASIGVPV